MSSEICSFPRLWLPSKRMRANASTSTCHGAGVIGSRRTSPYSHCCSHSRLFRQLNFPYDHKHNWRQIHSRLKVQNICRLSVRANAKRSSEWDEKSYKVSWSGKVEYLDEQDVVTFLDPPKELIPLDPSSYNPASYLWKKIEDIPEERRYHLLSLLNPSLISRAWEVAGKQFDDPKLVKKSASNLLSSGDCAGSLELWKCQTSGASLPIAWINSFQKALFCCRDGKTYGRLIGGYLPAGIMNSFFPLYFSVREVNNVMSTEQPCDLAYEFGNGLFTLPEFPQGFPKPAKHPWPFDDQVVVYVRHLGPGVVVGQAWQEGKALQQVPKKLCGEILMVKDG